MRAPSQQLRAAEQHTSVATIEDHGDPEHRVAVLPLELGEHLEVHAVDAAQERQRHEDHADRGQALHHLVGAMADHRHVEVEGARQDVAVGEHVGEHALDGGRHVRQEGPASLR